MDVVFVYIVDLIRKGLQEEGFSCTPFRYQTFKETCSYNEYK